MRMLAWIALALSASALAMGGHPDGWTRDEVAVLVSLRWSQLPPLPKDPSNAVEDSPAAVDLGRRLFFDTRLGRDQAVACASCHDPARQFQDGRPVGQGVGTGTRRAMPLAGAAYSPWLFWDGRKDSLWSQALGPLEDSAEHGGNRLRFAHLIANHYAKDYERVFGPLPALGHLPPDAGPKGSDPEKAAWRALDEATREKVSRVFANMGKAIAAYEKGLRHHESRMDRYVESVVGARAAGANPLDAQEVRGLRLFIGKGQCIDCHNGPLLTDQHFHNTGVPPRDPSRPDRGRAAALAQVAQDEFNCLGRFSDAKPEQCGELRFMVAQDESLEGAFKTPGLRDVALRPPYMHAGQIASLEDVLRHYAQAPHAAVGHSELSHAHGEASRAGRKPIQLSEAEQRDVVAFLKTLSGTPPVKAAPP
ncbi:MAG TPA: cytochrome c peroxidase [Albitalea sp.]|uniref:cytochrome-c peroxidase n=1 Tax=Piscinibacter sp. TaxID=1903157 RepID=UPI002ED15221